MARRPQLLASLALLLLAPVAAAQEHRHDTHDAHGADSDRHRGLLAGDGMGQAREAETNGYPGPKHVLELATELELRPQQREEVEAIRAAMLTEARRLGAELVEVEQELERRFAHRHIDRETLESLTRRRGELDGRLRFVHLVAHLETTPVLSTEQIEIYYENRPEY